MVIFFEHIILFLTSIGIVWFFSGLIVDAIDRMAARFHKSSFTVAFFVLGFLTSISEFSVMVNSTLAGAPQISAGNLSGASFIILLFIIPLLAIIGNGIQVKNTLPKKHLALVLAVIDRVGRELSEDPEWKDLILKTPKFLRVEDFADSAVIVKILGDTLPLKQWEVSGELRKRIKIAFDKEGISIPFPQRDVYIHNVR